MIEKKPIITAVVVCLAFGFLAGFYWPREKDVVIVPGDSANGGVNGSSAPADWTDPADPRPSPLLKTSDLPDGAINLEAGPEGCSPLSFEASPGQKITLSLTAKDKWSYLLRFTDNVLEEVNFGVSSQATRAISFLAPQEAGEYQFICSMAGAENSSPKGKLIVK